ncbi:hypothetical protein HK104_001687 [Borealophlyctis nickersoniae]|nr:hypothetical protein HK104_001687 [Borealophlyctis nickersoniae]
MRECGDTSLEAGNRAYVEIGEKVVEVEWAEVERGVACKEKGKRKREEVAGEAGVVEMIRKEVECGICLETLTNPHQLTTCLHSFCHPCILLAAPPPADVVCPVCQTITPQSGVKKNFVLANVVGWVNQVEEGEEKGKGKKVKVEKLRVEGTRKAPRTKKKN